MTKRILKRLPRTALTFIFLASLFYLPVVTAVTNVNITNNNNKQNEPMVAFNPTNNNKLVVGYIDDRSGNWRVGWSWSDNKGSNWTYGGSIAITGYARSADPVISFDTNGTAYLAGLTYNPDNTPGSLGKDGSIFLAKSNDGGHTFSVFKKIVATGSGTSNYLDKPWLYINPANNHIYLAWVKRVNAWGVGGTEASTIWFSKSTNGGQNFSTPVQVSTFSPATGSNRSHGPQITAVSANKVYVSWHTLETGTLPNPPTTPWKIWIAESTNGGGSFGTNNLAATSVWGYPFRFVSMDAHASTGKIYIAYADSTVMTPRDYDIFITSATSASGPWSTPTRVNDDPQNGRWQFFPALDVAANGRVDVIWYDYRDDPNKINIYYTASMDGGSTWAKNLKVTDVTPGITPSTDSFTGDYNTVASLNNRFYAVWMDNRLGNQEVFGVNIPQKPVDTMLVLDLSGSMLSPGCSGCASKLDVLKDSVEIFVQLWNSLAVAQPQHRLGVNYFRTNVNTLSSGGQVLLPIGPGNTNATTIINDVKSQSTVLANLTAMGGGLQAAINQLTSTRPRSIVLFTDGMQNVNPMVMEVGNVMKIDNDPAVTTNSNINPTTPNPTELNLQLAQKINTIGVGATPQFVTLLQSIATKTAGKSYTTTAPDNNLRRFFVEQLVDVLRGNSPQLIDYRYKTLAGASATETFHLNASASKLVFKISWRRGDPDIELESVRKEGSSINLKNLGSVIEEEFYRIYSVDLPLNAHGTPIDPQGNWHFQIKGTENTSYEVAAIADESALEYVFTIDKPLSKVGESLKLKAHLSVDGTPVTSGVNVTAKIHRPNVGLGTALSTHASPTLAQYQTEPTATAAQKKLEMLLQDEKFWQKLQPVEETIKLTAQADGTFAANYANTLMPGSYSVVFNVSGEHPLIGTFQRTEGQSIDVAFLAADLESSEVYIDDVDPGDDVTQMSLILRPRDIHGNYLGPDYGHRIKVFVAGSSQALTSYRDLLDGSYQYSLSVPTGSDPQVRVTVMDKALFLGALSELTEEKPDYQFALSAHLGWTNPMGNFNNSTDPNLLTELNLEYRYTPQFALHGVVGQYNFDPDYKIIGGTLYLRSYWPWRTKYEFYAEAGAGLFKADHLDGSSGISIGGGVNRYMKPDVAVELGVDYFHLFNEGNDIDFLATKIGVRFGF